MSIHIQETAPTDDIDSTSEDWNEFIKKYESITTLRFFYCRCWSVRFHDCWSNFWAAFG